MRQTSASPDPVAVALAEEQDAPADARKGDDEVHRREEDRPQEAYQLDEKVDAEGLDEEGGDQRPVGGLHPALEPPPSVSRRHHGEDRERTEEEVAKREVERFGRRRAHQRSGEAGRRVADRQQERQQDPGHQLPRGQAGLGHDEQRDPDDANTEAEDTRPPDSLEPERDSTCVSQDGRQNHEHADDAGGHALAADVAYGQVRHSIAGDAGDRVGAHVSER